MARRDENTNEAVDESVSAGAGAARQTYLFRLFKCDQPYGPFARYRLSDFSEVTVGRGEDELETRGRASDRQLHITIPDSWMSITHARLTKILGRWSVDDNDSRNGTVINGVRSAHAVLTDGDILEMGHSFFLFRNAMPASNDDPELFDPSKLPRAPLGLDTLVPVLSAQFSRLERLAGSDVSVLIQGESGSGKELVAQAIHTLSGKPGSFVAVNCGGLTPTLMHSELFGHKKGAFSGATEDRLGFIRSADHGTLFLDEIGDLPGPAQVAVLRVLQERQVIPVGGSKPINVAFRICAATHRHLPNMVTKGEFREDLLARLSGFSVRLPRLSERREDMGLLIAAILRRKGVENLSFTLKATRILLQHDWPHNIRELEKCLETAVTLAGKKPIGASHLVGIERAVPPAKGFEKRNALATQELNCGELPQPHPQPTSGGGDRRRDELIRLLADHAGNISEVARSLGKARFQIQRWIRRYRLNPKEFRHPNTKS